MHIFLFFLFFFTIVNPQSAKAEIPPAVLQQITNSYHPQIISFIEKRQYSIDPNCSILSVTIIAKDPITSVQRSVELKIYSPSSNSIDSATLKTILLLPPTGGENLLDSGYAFSFCRKNFRVALLQSWEHDSEVSIEDMGMHDRSAIRSIAAIRHTIEYLKIQRPKQLGVLGTSLGAIRAIMVLGLDPRIAAGAMIVGGVGIAETISISSEEGLSSLREQRMRLFQFQNINEYFQELNKKIKVEPADFVDHGGKKPVWIMVAEKDTTVPTRNQNDLSEKFGNRSDSITIRYNSDHLKTILHTYWYKRDDIADFFNKYLE